LLLTPQLYDRNSLAEKLQSIKHTFSTFEKMAYNNYGPSSSALAYNPSIYTLAPSIASPVYPASTMPSYTTTILTSSVILTSFVTVTSGQYAASLTPTPQDVLASTDLPSFSLESVTPTPEVVSSTTTEVPYINSTSTVTESSTTETAALATSDSVGTVGPVPTTSAPPPDFMGAAATVSSFKAAALAGGALGLVGFVFAEL
jgi:hypothetical protein